MLTEKDKETLVAAAMVIRLEARNYYDQYRHESNAHYPRAGQKAFEKYNELNRLANELDIVAFGDL